MKPKVIVILLNYNNAHHTVECIRSLKKVTFDQLQILVVDNGSTNGSLESMEKEFPDIEILRTGKNLGFAEGNNFGIRHVLPLKPDYILLLNNDTVVETNFLDPLISTMEANSTVAITGGTICYYPNRERIWYAGGRFVFWRASSFHCYLDQPYAKIKGLNERDVTFITGCMMLIRASVLRELGLLDKRLFMYFEDVEFCLRVIKAGYRLRYVPSSRIYHKISHKGDTPFTVYYGIRSRFILMKNSLYGWKRFIALAYLYLTLCLKLLFWRWSRKELFHSAVAALQDYVSGITTETERSVIKYIV